MVVKGQIINNRYQIIRLIGEGGMANVYLAYDEILDRNVAVKVLRGDLANDEKFIRRFQREANSASSLSHPNIVEMYDVGEDEEKYFIVMEYVDGKTLKSLIKRRGALTLPEVIDIMLQLTSAVSCAHDSYIIHRDIKPQNVLIKEDGRVKITDFGIAMALNSQELTQTNSVMGSVHYLPPEQANGSGSTIKSDIYSLGILMYELLTGKVPFKGENAVEIAIKQMKDQIPSICSMNPNIPQSIENIVLKASAKNPKNRYESASAMHEDLLNALKPEVMNQPRVTYLYPEQELEETKVMDNLVEEIKELEEKPKKSKIDKGLNIVLAITGTICFSLIALISLFVILYPSLTRVPEVVIPTVENMTVVEAENILKEAGFEVNLEVKEENSNTVEVGKIIGTSPSVSRKVKKGTLITLIVSLGEKGLTLEDYSGKNYYEIEAMLKEKGIYVLPEKKEVNDKDNYKENVIIEQRPVAGTRVVEKDTVTLVIPDIITEYPNFKDGTWTVSDVQVFCKEYNITLDIDYEATNDYKEGTIIYQSREAGSKVMPTSLKITVTKKEEEIVPEE